MNPRAARMFVLATSFLALAGVSAAAVMGLRLQHTRAELVRVQRDDGCPSPPRSTP